MLFCGTILVKKGPELNCLLPFSSLVAYTNRHRFGSLHWGSACGAHTRIWNTCCMPVILLVNDPVVEPSRTCSTFIAFILQRLKGGGGAEVQKPLFIIVILLPLALGVLGWIVIRSNSASSSRHPWNSAEKGICVFI